MNDNTITDVLAVDVEQQEAMNLHLKIKANLEMAATALLDACQGLKEMKEGDKYKALGFEKFEDYTESALGIKSRMAYYYIATYDRLGPALLEENAGLGITKLRLLSEVSPLDREGFLEDTDLDGMSVEEIREAVKERNGLREQLTLFQNSEATENGTDGQEREVLEEAIRKTVQAEADAEKEKAVKAARQEAAKEATQNAQNAAKAEMEKAVAEATKRAEEKAKADMAVQLAALEEETAAAEARVSKLEKELNLSASTETAAFALHFDQLQQHFSEMLELIDVIQAKGDKVGAEKLASALEKGMSMLTAKHNRKE